MNAAVINGRHQSVLAEPFGAGPSNENDIMPDTPADRAGLNGFPEGEPTPDRSDEQIRRRTGLSSATPRLEWCLPCAVFGQAASHKTGACRHRGRRTATSAWRWVGTQTKTASTSAARASRYCRRARRPVRGCRRTRRVGVHIHNRHEFSSIAAQLQCSQMHLSYTATNNRHTDILHIIATFTIQIFTKTS